MDGQMRRGVSDSASKFNSNVTESESDDVFKFNTAKVTVRSYKHIISESGA